MEILKRISIKKKKKKTLGEYTETYLVMRKIVANTKKEKKNVFYPEKEKNTFREDYLFSNTRPNKTRVCQKKKKNNNFHF